MISWCFVLVKNSVLSVYFEIDSQSERDLNIWIKLKILHAKHPRLNMSLGLKHEGWTRQVILIRSLCYCPTIPGRVS